MSLLPAQMSAKLALDLTVRPVPSAALIAAATAFMHARVTLDASQLGQMARTLARLQPSVALSETRGAGSTDGDPASDPATVGSSDPALETDAFEAALWELR